MSNYKKFYCFSASCFFAIVISGSLFGQKRPTYNTNIEKAKDVIVKGGKTTVIKADKVIIISDSSKRSPSDIYIKRDISQSIDSTGTHTTVFTFSNPEIEEFNSIDIIMEFDKAILEEPRITGNFISFNSRIMLSEDKKVFRFTFKKLNTDSPITVTIKSLLPIRTKISGVAKIID